MTRISVGGKLSRWTPLLAGAIILLLVLQGFVQSRFEKRYRTIRIENLLYLPQGEHLKVMSLGFRTLLADALWVKAVSYFGGHSLSDQEYPWLYHILDQITDLDPPFHHPYTFGGVVLSLEEGAPAKSIALLKKGMNYYPGDWVMPFYVGFDYFYYLKDPVTAADYIQVAAMIPGHPEYLPRLAASLMTKSGRLEAAIAFLETVAENTENERVRMGLYEKIKNLRAGIMPKGLEKFLKEKGS